MKKFITTLSNIWKIDDLRVRLINTLLFLLIYRVGSYVVLPGVNANSINAKAGNEGLIGLLNMFSGGSFAHASIFALGVMPYISASIVVQLLGIAVPYFAKLQKEGESGRNKLNQWTRYLTIGITALQAVGYLKSQISAEQMEILNPFFTILNVCVLTAGTMFVMWLGEKITDKGVGNGISLIIMVGIISALPGAFASEFVVRNAGAGGLVTFVVEIVALIGVVMFTVLIVQGKRKVAVQYAKRIVGNKQYGGVRQYIPLMVNAAGVMPIIFAQALMFIPAYIPQFWPKAASNPIMISLSDYRAFGHNLLFAVLIIVFTFFYTAITINPNQMAEDMKKNGGFIPGIKPGRATADFLDGVISKITLPGSIFLAIVAVFPAVAALLGVNSNFARFFGGTSLIILVGVVLDTLQQIESHLLMRHYDGLMKTGRIKGRTSIASGGTSQPVI
jgi:preprotein translocase subunit SecY